MNIAQVIAVRSTFALLIMGCIMHKNTYRYMISSVPRSQYGTLALRSLQGAVGLMCLYNAIKYFSLMNVSLVQNLAPLLIALLSFYLFNVGLSRVEILALGCSFIGVIILLTGGKQSGDDELEDEQEEEMNTITLDMILPTVCLLVIPLNSAAIKLYLRQMRDISELTIGAYTTLSMFLIYSVIVIWFYSYSFL